MVPDISPELDAALFAVDRAGTLVRSIQLRLVTDAMSKDDRSPVTVADFASQALIEHLLHERLGDHVLVGEEDASMLKLPAHRAALQQVANFAAAEIPGVDQNGVCELIDRGGASPGKTFWTVDPIDGTKGFLRGDQYAIALAFVQSGRVEIAAVACPRLADPLHPVCADHGTVFFAARGIGAWRMPMQGAVESAARLTVSQTAAPGAARLLRSVESGHTNTGTVGQLLEKMQIDAPPVALDSQAKYAVLAAGGAELMVRFLSVDRPDYEEKIWDQAAGSLLVEEAGGKATDLDGRPFDFSQGRTLAKNRGVLATNGVLHDAAVASIRAIGA